MKGGHLLQHQFGDSPRLFLRGFLQTFKNNSSSQRKTWKGENARHANMQLLINRPFGSLSVGTSLEMPKAICCSIKNNLTINNQRTCTPRQNKHESKRIRVIQFGSSRSCHATWRPSNYCSVSRASRASRVSRVSRVSSVQSKKSTRSDKDGCQQSRSIASGNFQRPTV